MFRCITNKLEQLVLQFMYPRKHCLGCAGIIYLSQSECATVVMKLAELCPPSYGFFFTTACAYRYGMHVPHSTASSTHIHRSPPLVGRWRVTRGEPLLTHLTQIWRVTRGDLWIWLIGCARGPIELFRHQVAVFGFCNV